MVRGAILRAPFRALEGAADRIARLSMSELHVHPQRLARYLVTELGEVPAERLVPFA
jgi:hypothetical protein